MQRVKLSHVLTFLSGLLLGWLAIGWWLWPVAYVGDAYTYELNQADKLRYAQGAVDAFTLTGQVDPDWFSGWTGDEIKDELEQIVQQPNRANSTRAMAEKMGLLLGWRVNINPTPVPLTVKLSKAEVSESSNSNKLIYVGLALLVILAMGSGMWLIWRNRAVNPGPARGFETAFLNQTPVYHDLKSSQYVPSHQTGTALAQAQLTFGPDQPCDQHFPIERDGQHLGEFGVSQVEDEPAWDVWLFDQKALVTVTKVLANQASEELAGRGEVIGLNSPVVLDTPGLRMAGKAVQFGDGIKVELSVEEKGE